MAEPRPDPETAPAGKPLGGKAYGSTPHLPGSRLGPGDHSCHAGQETICWVKARDRHDRIIVTEKLDGSCTAVARLPDGSIVALGRAGYLAQTSKYEQHQLFAAWVREREGVFREALAPGERMVGEWMAQAHGTRYRLAGEPWIPFDVIGARRLPHDEARRRMEAARLVGAAVLHDGGPAPLSAILGVLDSGGHHGACDPVEGAVWRVERKGAFDFIAKWVRHDKKDGCLLPELTGAPPVWNWRPTAGRDAA